MTCTILQMFFQSLIIINVFFTKVLRFRRKWWRHLEKKIMIFVKKYTIETLFQAGEPGLFTHLFDHFSRSSTPIVRNYQKIPEIPPQFMKKYQNMKHFGLTRKQTIFYIKAKNPNLTDFLTILEAFESFKGTRQFNIKPFTSFPKKASITSLKLGHIFLVAPFCLPLGALLSAKIFS